MVRGLAASAKIAPMVILTRKLPFLPVIGAFLLALALLSVMLPEQVTAMAALTPTPTPDNQPFATLNKDSDLPYESIGPDYYFPWINPLTGLQVENPELLQRRPMAIKVTNYPRSTRPPSGLSLADVVYEYYMERSITRFIGVFYGNDASRVGPVRSGRFFDEHIFTMYDSSFTFGYADKLVMDYWREEGPEVLRRFALEGQISNFYDCSATGSYPLCRDRSLVTYNNMFADTRALADAVERQNGLPNTPPDLTGMRFAYRPPEGGAAASGLFFRYSLIIYGKWEYSPELNQYLRYQETSGYADPGRETYAALSDALTDEQLSADNVVVLFVPHQYYKKTDTTEIIQIDLIGSGTAVVFRDGQAFPAVWIRPADGGVLRLYGAGGEDLPLKPGQTWYQVLSLESSYTTNGDEWRFVFSPPEVPDEPILPPTPTPTPEN